MADIMTKEQRSRAMAAVRGKGNKTTEIALAKIMRSEGITGWRRHLTNVTGKPDFIFPQRKIAVFVDGCFWHGCPQCGTIPRSNRIFWKRKIERNIMRDKIVNGTLKKTGWKVVRIWEHEMKKGIKTGTLKKIKS